MSSAASRDVLGSIQWWLQGHPNKRRPQIAVKLGNLISDYRYWLWRRGNDG